MKEASVQPLESFAAGPASSLELQSAATHADKGLRAAGYLIDVLPAIVLGLFGMIPMIGPIMAGLLLAPNAQQDFLREVHPLKRLGTPEDVARAALFLASDEASWVTGIVFDVAGGAVMV
jgi:NAD(P)-dependent dehydrogenase (short-subunit alcohol dehydrogenase family)